MSDIFERFHLPDIISETSQHGGKAASGYHATPNYTLADEYRYYIIAKNLGLGYCSKHDKGEVGSSMSIHRYMCHCCGLHAPVPKEQEPRRISFMEKDTAPYASLLIALPSAHPSETSAVMETADLASPLSSRARLMSILSRQSETYPSCTETIIGSLGRHDTMLLDLVREHNHELQEALEQPLDLPRDDIDDNSSIEPCTHGLSHRYTERSVSRSRFSRISTRRDMDIPSILAFNISDTPPTRLLGIPAFQAVASPKSEDIPRWSVRRSTCPVCSQKWKDRSTINKIKSSGLKRNAFSEMPSVIAPARLRTAGTEKQFRPVIPDAGTDMRLSPGLRNTSASWQLIRARRIRTPKIQMPVEASAPPSITAPLAQKNLDTRVNNFLSR